MARAPGLQFIAPMEMVIGPAPTEWAVATARTPGGNQVVVQLVSVNGVQVYFFPEAVAKQLGEALAQASGAGILVVPAGTVIR